MSIVRRLISYVHDVVDTVHEVLAFDDPLFCDCGDEGWCTDCALLAPLEPVPGWSAPLDAA